MPPVTISGRQDEAAQALLGPKFRVSVQRGQFIESPLAEYVTATVHPSSILRAPTGAAKRP